MKMTLPAACALAALTFALPRICRADPRNPKPDWVDGSSMEYPREGFITGVGAADDRASAEDRARGEIAKVFSTKVSVRTDSLASETDNAAGGNFSQAVSESVETASRKVLEGAQVVDHWEDPETKVRYALAVLDRAKAKAAIVDKLASLDAQALQWKGQLDSETGKLVRAKAAMRLLRLLKAREDLNSELRVVDASGQGAKPPFDESVVRPMAAKAVAALDVSVAISGEGSSELETGVIEGLNAFGLQALQGASRDADLEVAGRLSSVPMQGDGSQWKWARSNATITLKDGHSGKVVSQFDASDREASSDYGEAVRRSRVELAKLVSGKLSGAITAYFENQ